MMSGMRKTLVAGLLTVTPLALTVYVFYFLFHFFDGLLSNTVIRFVFDQLGMKNVDAPPGIGLLLLIALLFITGTFARNYVGKKMFDLGGHIVTKIPIINRIYIASRQLSEAFLSEKRETFKRAVLIEYPRKGVYSIGFFTQDTSGPIQDAIEEDVVSIFVPTTPVPTSGYLLFVPKEDVVELDMSVEDALKLVISAGSIQVASKIGLERLLEQKKSRKEKRKNKTSESTD